MSGYHDDFESLENAEFEKKFRCPYCHEKISMVLDVSESGHQTYVEDCEVCCKPIQLSFVASHGKITGFTAQSI
jgi:transcription elongation factor Elf1